MTNSKYPYIATFKGLKKSFIPTIIDYDNSCAWKAGPPNQDGEWINFDDLDFQPNPMFNELFERTVEQEIDLLADILPTFPEEHIKTVVNNIDVNHLLNAIPEGKILDKLTCFPISDVIDELGEKETMNALDKTTLLGYCQYNFDFDDLITGDKFDFHQLKNLNHDRLMDVIQKCFDQFICPLKMIKKLEKLCKNS
jgi:hypothetical protein